MVELGIQTSTKEAASTGRRLAHLARVTAVVVRHIKPTNLEVGGSETDRYLVSVPSLDELLSNLDMIVPSQIEVGIGAAEPIADSSWLMLLAVENLSQSLGGPQSIDLTRGSRGPEASLGEPESKTLELGVASIGILRAVVTLIGRGGDLSSERDHAFTVELCSALDLGPDSATSLEVLAENTELVLASLRQTIDKAIVASGDGEDAEPWLGIPLSQSDDVGAQGVATLPDKLLFARSFAHILSAVGDLYEANHSEAALDLILDGKRIVGQTPLEPTLSIVEQALVGGNSELLLATCRMFGYQRDGHWFGANGQLEVDESRGSLDLRGRKADRPVESHGNAVEVWSKPLLDSEDGIPIGLDMDHQRPSMTRQVVDLLVAEPRANANVARRTPRSFLAKTIAIIFGYWSPFDNHRPPNPHNS